MRSALSLAAILAICALAHAQAPDAGVDAPIDASVSADAGVDAAPPPVAPVPVDAAPPPVDAAGEADASGEVATPVLMPPSRREDAAWLLVGGALTFVTTAVVLAYAAESTETDIEDLYVSLNGQPFDAKTQERYDDLVKQGNRYQYLSWISFGVAGGMAIGATVLFWKHHNESKVTPIVTPNSAGVSVRF